MGNEAFFDTARRVLWRCVVMGILIVTLWYGLALFPDNPLWISQQRLLGLSPHEIALVNYAGIALAKLLIYVFFLIPWVAILLVRKKGV